MDTLYKEINRTERPEIYASIYNNTMLSTPQICAFRPKGLGFHNSGFHNSWIMIYYIRVGEIIGQLNQDFSCHWTYTDPHLNVNVNVNGNPSLYPVREGGFVYSERFPRFDNPTTNSPIYHFLLQVMSARLTQMTGVVLLIAGLALMQSGTLGLGMAATGAGILACSFFSKCFPGTRAFDIRNINLDNNFQPMQAL